MNNLDLCLEVVSKSRQPLRFIWRWISRKPLEIEAWFQRTTNRKWHMSYRMGFKVTWRHRSSDHSEWSSDRWRHVTLKGQTRDPNMLRAQMRNMKKTRKLLELETSNLVCSFVSGMPSGRINNFPWKWAWPRSRDPYNFWQYGRLS